MIGMLAGTAAIAVAVVLLASFAAQLYRPGTLPRALSAHGTLPPALVRPVAAAAVLAEGGLGAATALAVLAGTPASLHAAGTGAAALFTTYAMYGRLVLRTRPGLPDRPAPPCGCAGAARTPLTGWAVARAALLAALAATAATGAWPAAALDGSRLAVAALAGAAFATLLWQLPAALHDPARRPAGTERTTA